MSDTSKHVDELTILRLADHELSREREEATRAHLIACARCRSAYEGLKAETELLRAAVRVHDEALPDHIRPRHADISWVLVAILVFGTFGVSSLWTRYVTPMVEGMETVGVDSTSVATSILIRSVLWRGWSNMLTQFIQGALLLVVVVVAGYALHRAWRRIRSSSTAALSLVLLAGASAVMSPTPATAAVVELEAGVYTLHEGEIIDNDLVIAGKSVRIEGTVAGDLIVAAGTVEIVGEVRGDVLGFAETIDVTGRVGGNVRTASRRLQIDGEIARNVTAAGETLRSAPGASLGGSLIWAGREAILEAPMPRDIIVAAETSEIHAPIAGSALLAGERLAIGPDGGVEGTTRFYGGEEPVVDPDAELASPIEFERVEHDSEESMASRIAEFFYFWTAAFIFGAVVLLLTPEASEEIVTRHVPDYGQSFARGAIATVVLFAFGILVTITIVGAPLGVTTLFALGMGLYFAQVYVAAYIGREILGTPTSASAGLLRLALGLFLIYVGKSIPIVSFVVVVIVALWGFGALTSYVLGRYQKPTTTEAPAEV